MDQAVSVFTSSVTSILDRTDMAPVTMFHSHVHYASWLSDKTKDIMKQRDEAMDQYNRTGLPEYWEVARGLRNTVTRLLKTDKCNSNRRKVQQCEFERESRRV